MKKLIAILLTFCIIASLNIISVFAVTPLASTDVSTYLSNISATVKQNNTVIADTDKLYSTSPVNVSMSFKVPVLGDGVAPYVNKGDFATISLAAGFELPANAGPFDLVQGVKKVGTLRFVKNNTNIDVNIVFDGDDDVFGNGYSDVNCLFSVDLNYDASGLNGAEGDHNVIIYQKAYTLTVPPLPTVVTAAKSGALNGQLIDWVVKVDAVKGTSAGDISGYLFSDDITNVGTYEAGTFKVGTDNNVANAIAPANGLTNSGTKLEYTFEPNTTGTRYIFFSTKIADDIFFTNTKQTIKNNASVSNGADIVTSTTAEVSFTHNWLTKAETHIDHKTGNITWTITANTQGATLPNAVITDALDINKVEWVSAEWFKEVGNTWETTGTSITPVAGNDYSFGTISTPIMLKITAHIIPTLDLEHTVQTVANTATLTWSKDPAIGSKYSMNSNTVNSEIGLNPISKTGVSYNATTHEAQWRVSVEKSDVNNNLRIVELLVYSSTKFSTSAIYDISNNTGALLTQINPTALLTLTPSYNQKYVNNSFLAENASDVNITVHTVSVGGTAIADLLIITKSDGTGIDVATTKQSFTYKTIATNPDIYLSNINAGGNIKRLYNAASLLSADVLVNSSEAIVNCPSNIMNKDTLSAQDALNDLKIPANASKITNANANRFNYTDKSVVYRLHINSSGANITGGLTADGTTALGKATITDVLPQGWEFVDIANGAKYYVFDGTGNGINVTANDLLDPSTLPIIADFGSTGKAAFTFATLDKPYVILLKAKPNAATASGYFSANSAATTRNNATLTVDKSKWSGNASDYEDVTISPKVLAKTKAVTQAGVLTWKIDYNPYDVTYNNTVILDTIPNGIDLRTNSFGALDLRGNNITIHELNFDKDGNTVLGSVVADIAHYVSYDVDKRELTFTPPDQSKGYSFGYITDVTGASATSITNSVKFVNRAGGSFNVSDSYDISSADVSATMKRSGWIEITKKNSAGAKLAGAEFVLLSADGKTEFRSGITNANGVVTLRGLPSGDYILKETVAPVGYALSHKSYNVKIVVDSNGVITSVDGVSTNALDIINYNPGTVGSLLISKSLQGNAADYQKEFEFEITVAGANGNYPFVKNGVTYGNILFANGKARFMLKGNENIVIHDLPQGVAYSITQNDYTADGYLISKPYDAGNILADTTLNVAFESIKNINPTIVSPPLSSTPKTGQPSFSFIWIIALVLSAVGMLLFVVDACKKRK